ncbi:MAG: peptidoglycan DD-metalloendopeptidase family protein [Candidatus Lokiarchaeota archaeon]|nr:peptidoglycan DD-metalloendopeptidase family protein [Candidatus Lokiarchaeota archaeon]
MMIKSEFYYVVNSEGIKVAVHKNSHFSVGTSPYYAHQFGLAIDIYQHLPLVNYDVFSPVSGIVLKTKELIAPKPKFTGGISKDYLIIIQNLQRKDLVYKLLHVKPTVKEGQNIEIGQVIGTTIRNGYFAYWSSPHVHLEIRSKDDAVRARGGKTFLLARSDFKSSIKKQLEPEIPIPIKIHSVFPEFILAKLTKEYYFKIDPIFGIKGKFGDSNCIIDGGLPQYKNGIIILPDDFKSSANVIFWGSYKIGSLMELRKQFGLFYSLKLKFKIDGRELRGLSLFLANFTPLVKLIPINKGEFSFRKNTIHYLSLT